MSCVAFPLSATGLLPGRRAIRGKGLHLPSLDDSRSFHAELWRVEARHSLTIASVVEVLSEASVDFGAAAPGVAEALEAVVETHVGAALLLAQAARALARSRV